MCIETVANYLDNFGMNPLAQLNTTVSHQHMSI